MFLHLHQNPHFNSGDHDDVGAHVDPLTRTRITSIGNSHLLKTPSNRVTSIGDHDLVDPQKGPRHEINNTAWPNGQGLNSEKKFLREEN